MFKTGDTPWNKGISLSEEHRNNIGKANKGRINYWMLGDKNVAKRPEIREKIRVKATGRKAPSTAFKNGKEHPLWNGGTSLINYPREFYKMRKILTNTKTNCESCGKHKKDINHRWLKNFDIHHIDGDKMNNEKENLMVLCRDCHVSVFDEVLQ